MPKKKTVKEPEKKSSKKELSDKEKQLKRYLYTFDVSVDKEHEKEIEVEKTVEVEKDVEVNRRRKNKDTGKMESVAVIEKRKVKEKQTSTETRVVNEPINYRIVIRKPTRSQLEDGDMYYSLQLNKFIKKGLMTKAMLAKQYSDLGGTFTKEQQDEYARIYSRYYTRLNEVQRFSVRTEDEMSESQKKRLEQSVGELAILRKQITEFESSQSMLFEHTADVKSRNRAILWYILHLSYFVEGDLDEFELDPMFEGEGFDEKYDVYRTLEENEDPLYIKAVDKISSIVTIWYMSGVQTTEDIDSYLEQVDKDSELDETHEELDEVELTVE
jgi:hypothetical protein